MLWNFSDTVLLHRVSVAWGVFSRVKSNSIFVFSFHYISVSLNLFLLTAGANPVCFGAPLPTPPPPYTYSKTCMRSFHLTSSSSAIMILCCVLIFSRRDNLYPILYWKWRYPLYTSSKDAPVHVCVFLSSWQFFSPDLSLKIYSLCMLIFPLHFWRRDTSPCV